MRMAPDNSRLSRVNGPPLTVVVFGTFDERQHPRVEVLIEALLGLGHFVIWCNEPLEVSTKQRISATRRPLQAVRLISRLLTCWWRLVRKAWGIGRHTPDVVLVGYLGVLDVHLARLCFSAPVILDNMAPVTGIAKDRSLPFGKFFSLVDRLAAKAVDVIVWDTEEHMSAGPPDCDGIVVPVGAPTRWFQQSGRIQDPSTAMSICFFGLYTPLQGTNVIAEAIWLLRDCTDLTWTLIGHGQNRSKAEEIVGAVTSVKWIDWLDAEQLPKVLAEHDVCLGIFGSTSKATRVVPNKVYQGAAAGCAIITSDTPPQRAALGDAACYVPVADPKALAGAIRKLADDRVLLSKMQAASYARADDQFSPRSIGIQLQQALEAATAASHSGRRRMFPSRRP